VQKTGSLLFKKRRDSWTFFKVSDPREISGRLDKLENRVQIKDFPAFWVGLDPPEKLEGL